MKMTNTFHILRRAASRFERDIDLVSVTSIHEISDLLQQVSTRAAAIDDAKLNALMCQLCLYSIADPNSPDYDTDAIALVIRRAEQDEKPFGEQIKVERIRLELTREGMAHILGVSARAIQSWENNDRVSNPSMLTQLGATTKLREIPSAAAAARMLKGVEA